MPGILFKQLKIFTGKFLNVFTQSVKTFPKLRRSAVHLQVSQLTSQFSNLSFFAQKVKLAGRRVFFQLFVPELPVFFG